MEKINLSEKLGRFSEHWSPKIIAELNGQQVKLAKLQGEFVWHKHDAEDELFLVLKGRLFMDFRDRTVELGPGELIVVPVAWSTARAGRKKYTSCFSEPASTLNTGDVENERTKKELDWI